MKRQRCAGRGCQHARSRHDAGGHCTRCDGCPGYASRRRHWWRELAWETWQGAHQAWWLAREAECLGYATEEAEYQAPQPTFKEILIGLSQREGSTA